MSVVGQQARMQSRWRFLHKKYSKMSNWNPRKKNEVRIENCSQYNWWIMLVGFYCWLFKALEMVLTVCLGSCNRMALFVRVFNQHQYFWFNISVFVFFLLYSVVTGGCGNIRHTPHRHFCNRWNPSKKRTVAKFWQTFTLFRAALPASFRNTKLQILGSTPQKLWVFS